MATPEDTPPPEPTAEESSEPMETDTADAPKDVSEADVSPEKEQPATEKEKEVPPAEGEIEEEPAEPLSQEPKHDEIDTLVNSPSNSESPGLKRKPVRARRDSAKRLRGEDECKEEWLLPFEMGWTREVVFRGTSVNTKPKNCDVYYRPPMGAKCRSMVDVEKFLSLNNIKKPTIHNFTFNHRPIYKEPYEVVRSAKQSWGRNVSRTPTGETKKADRSLNSSLSDYTPKGSPASPSKVPTKKVLGKRIRKPKEPFDSSPPRQALQKVLIKTVDPQAKKKKPKKQVFSVVSKLPSNPPLAKTKKLCNLTCPGRESLPPSLPCDVCMCMFHPECVGSSGTETYVCLGCQKPEEKETIAPLKLIVSSSSMPTLTSIIRAPRPPPLKAAPPRPTPPSMVQPQPVTLSGSPLMIRPTATVVPVLAPVAPAPVAPAPTVVSTHSELAARLVPPPVIIPEPQSESPPPNGQLLSLPASVAHKLDMTKSLALKVNNQRYFVPPSCFFASPEGIKVFLPAGSLPQTVAKTPANPLDCTILRNKKNQTLTQVVKLKPFEEDKCVIGKKLLDIPCNGDKTGTRFPARELEINPGLCFMSSLHAGSYVMRKIFTSLSLADLLSARSVCKLWRNILDDQRMWRSVALRGETVTDWQKAADFFYDHDVHNLDLRGCRSDDPSKTWLQFSSALPKLRHLRRVNLGGCPSHVIHSTIEKCRALEAFAAEVVIRSEQDVPCETDLDVEKLSSMVYLEELSLQSSSSLLLPPEADLNSLQSLTCLRKLTLTTLRKTPSQQFLFLGSLVNLESLKIGDCTMWDSDVHFQLGKLEKLKSLRLEGGGNNSDIGLTDALKKLTKLENLELIRFYVDLSLAELLPTLTHLKTLFITPDGPMMAEVNNHTVRGASGMSFLQQLDWGIMPDRNFPSEEIPFLQRFDDETPVKVSDADSTSILIDINELVDFLCDRLAETRIRVFRVPRFDVGV
ncbi:hypothetical protein CAPTEDRAFT_219279 [Capitella teleta]|uniref:MBD domain-containing protein n=1 Tax=Capitella teleta TaxID=283909 RepID=R7VFK8_CAPTE|nr:hypothetical protein CAPTEDRAFT_219279 [Capitella teleta]|eukprot:ELU17357.1 hypothetical protein CAPTEDRAFT_219279 [Capitella teleta]